MLFYALEDLAFMKNKSIHHWIIVAICCGLSAASIGICFNSLGVFFTPVSAELGVGIGAFALHVTFTNLLIGLFSTIGMKLVKKYHFRTMVSLGILMAGGSTMLMSLGHNIWEFYLLGAVRGIGCSLFALVIITYIIGNWFDEKHGFAVGLTLSFSGLSGAFFSPMLGYLITQVGWRYTYLITGICIIVLALPGTLLLLEPQPEKRHLLPYGGKMIDKAAQSAKVASARKVEFLSIPFIAVALFATLVPAITGITQHFPGYVESLGSTAAVGAMMISAAMIGNIIFKLLIGLLSDKIGPVNACSVMISVNLLSLILLMVTNPVENQPILLASAFLFGTTYAVGAVGTSLVTRHVFGVEQYAAVYPYISICIAVGSATSLTITGLLYDLFGTYQFSLFGGIAFGVLSLLILQGLRAWRPAPMPIRYIAVQSPE
jgi:MFS family permease